MSGKDIMGVFDEVKERVTARAVMERVGIVFNRSNMCKCPFHQDKTASMKVKLNDKKYFCFCCGEKGDAIASPFYPQDSDRQPFSALCRFLFPLTRSYHRLLPRGKYPLDGHSVWLF